ncbi:MAG TPA: hypothetical protein VGN86_05830 [Pyrinomonadaceae bacterium]|jgi:hypothetical protein|nr:hypothetical protein [Pyrinomonadaceae bacterium]
MRRVLSLLRGAAFNLLVSSLLVLVCSGIAASQANLSWCPPGTSGSTTSAISSCGATQKVDFNVNYGGLSCTGVIGSTPYKYEFFLYRNGVQIGYYPYSLSSSCLVTKVFPSVDALPGYYHAKVNFGKQTSNGWVYAAPAYTASIFAFKTSATPAFTINGQLATTTSFPTITVNISQPITIDATATTCETTYHIGVQESELNWDRTYKYEWSKWFPGTAPNNINLQQLATTYSYPPDFSGDPTRIGTPLFGGDLSPGIQRYYRINLCTVEPSWACATAILRVNP